MKLSAMRAQRSVQYIFIGLMLSTPLINSVQADANAPIEISADSKKTDFKAGLATYQGAVDIQQGSLHATGDQADLELEQGELVRAILTGNPATFEKTDEQGERIRGHADRAEYAPATQILTLTGKAELERAGDTLRAPIITYNLETEQAEAGDPDSGERVTTTIAPRSEPTE